MHSRLGFCCGPSSFRFVLCRSFVYCSFVCSASFQLYLKPRPRPVGLQASCKDSLPSQAVFLLPARLRLAIGAKAYALAVDAYIGARPVLKRAGYKVLAANPSSPPCVVHMAVVGGGRHRATSFQVPAT